MRRLVVCSNVLICALQSLAGGPRYTAGTAYFNTAAFGKPVVWASGSLSYSTDRGELSAYASNATANAMVGAAAAPWNGIATTTVNISAGASLAEDVNGSNVTRNGNTVTYPADVTNPALEIAIIYDADGSVLNTVIGPGASDASGCLTNAVWSDTDQFTPAGNIAHAIIILNGLCATTATQLSNMQYLLEREFGRVLGLDWSQANDNVISRTPTPNAQQFIGWPLMHPLNLNCGGNNYACLPSPYAPRMDDRAALGRLYPSASFAGNVIHFTGTVSFPNGTGMQGINVVATHVWTGTTTPDFTMVASATTGSGFRGNAGSVVLGTLDANGNSLDRFGSESAAAQAAFDLSGVELPAGTTAADYMLTFEPVNALYTGAYSVGPEIPGTPVPSGTLPAPIYLRNLTAGSTTVENITVADAGTAASAITAQASPSPVPSPGGWNGSLGTYGQTAWSAFAVRPSRTFAVIAQATDETGAASGRKLMPVLGIWNASDNPGGLPDFFTPQPFDSSATGTTMLEVTSPAATGPAAYAYIAAIADLRGDGRPDYTYAARLLYAATLSPSSVPLAGGEVVISGAGFPAGPNVSIGGVAAAVLLSSPTAMLVRAPALASSQAADVEIDDPATGAFTVMPGALAYGAATGTATQLGVISAPSGDLPAGTLAPVPFTVIALDGNQSPASGVSVQFAITQGSGTLSPCNAAACAVVANSSGIAQVSVLPQAAGSFTVTASIASGAVATVSINATTGTTLALYPNSPPLYIEAQSPLSWTASIAAMQNGAAAQNVSVTWSSNFSSATSTSTTNVAGHAQQSFSVPALTSSATAQVQACVTGTTMCVTLPITAESPIAVSAFATGGSRQSVPVGTAYANIGVRVVDGQQPANPLAGFPVTITQYAYAWNAFAGPRTVPAVLAARTSTAVSDALGNLSIVPLQVAGHAQTTVICVRAGANTLSLFTLTTTPG